MHDTHLKRLKGRTVLVTGGAGLVGSRITARLRRLGARAIGLCTLDAYPQEVYRDLFGVDPEHPDIVVGSIEDPVAVGKVVAECDYVVHAAALADVAACTRLPMAAVRTDIAGTQVLLDAVARSRRVRRFCFVSSASVYGNGDPDDWAPACGEHAATRRLLESVYGRTPPRFHERAPLRPMSVYGNTKAWGETQTALVLRAVPTSYTVVRYFSVYGEPQVVKENSHSWVVAWFAARAALGLPLHLNGGGRQIRDLVHVDDVATAPVRSLRRRRGRRPVLGVAEQDVRRDSGVADGRGGRGHRDQMIGGRPSRVIRQTVVHRIGRRGGHEVRSPSARPPNQARRPTADLARASVRAIQTPR
ncbi:hypothetical protein GCM10027168_57140 [Streptomyces capparidis]